MDTPDHELFLHVLNYYWYYKATYTNISNL